MTRCPQCRDETPRNEVEPVRYTPSQQWDELLEVAKEWAEMDTRRADDTSEEEDEEAFIDDESTDVRYDGSLWILPIKTFSQSRLRSYSSSAALDPPDATEEGTPESDMPADRAVTPPAQPEANGARSYLDSPAATKRKRLEALAEQRRTKMRL